MTLSVTITKFPPGVKVVEKQKNFGEQGGSIGRSQDNDWVLDDPERYLSSRHSQISFEGGRYFLTDLSTNGTFLNGSLEPLGKGVRAQLNSGDCFSLGDYEFLVELWQADEASSGVFSSAQFADDPFARPSPGPYDGSDIGLNDGLFASSSVSGPNTVFNVAPEETDPLAALDKVEYDPGSHGPDDVFGVSYSDGADALNQSVNWPDVQPETAGVIPEDWDKTSFGVVKPAKPLTNPPVRPAPPPRRPQRKAPSPVSEKVDSKEQSLECASRKIQQELEELRQLKQAVTERTAASGVDTTLITAMGLTDNQLSPQRIAEINQVVGELVRETVIGLMQTLTSRSSIKNEFRMQVTTIQPVENNPLKFSATVDDALDNMFVKQSKSYMNPVESIREGFQSIAEHQLAVVAGIRQAFKGVLDAFDPEQLEQRFERQYKGSVVLGSRKAKLWDSFAEYYKSLVDDMDSSFQYIFGDEFVQAYEDQLRRLAQAHKTEQSSE